MDPDLDDAGLALAAQFLAIWERLQRVQLGTGVGHWGGCLMMELDEYGQVLDQIGLSGVLRGLFGLQLRIWGSG